MVNVRKKGKIGIISPYKGQIRLLQNNFEDKLGPNWKDFIEINTVDAY